MSSFIKKLMPFIILAGVLCVSFGIDSIISKTYRYDVLSITPKVAYADSKTPVMVKLKLLQGSRAVAGHELFGIVDGGGNFRDQRIVTDNNGEAVFVYYPYLANDYVKAKTVTLKIMDESNSILVSVPAQVKISLPLKQPDNSGNKDETVDSIFG